MQKIDVGNYEYCVHCLQNIDNKDDPHTHTGKEVQLNDENCELHEKVYFFYL